MIWNWILIVILCCFQIVIWLFHCTGFLPEELDKFFVKYLYPTFTPTVVLFVAGTVAYGGLKYLQNEKAKDQKWITDEGR